MVFHIKYLHFHINVNDFLTDLCKWGFYCTILKLICSYYYMNFHINVMIIMRKYLKYFLK